jgi:hypothetical protein
LLDDSLSLFAEIGRHLLLTAAEEAAHKRVERGDPAAGADDHRTYASSCRRSAYRHGVPLPTGPGGVIGPNRAVEKFDWRKATSLT